MASVSAVARPCAATKSPIVLPAKSGSPQRLANSASMRGPAPGSPNGHDREQLVARAGDEKLQLAMLVDRAKRTDRRRAFATLAKAFRPELHIPAGEALEPVGIAHQHRDAFAISAKAIESAAPTAAGTSAAGLRFEHRRERHGGAAPYRADVEAEHGGGQQTHIGEHRETPADAGVVIEEGHAERREQIAQTVALAAGSQARKDREPARRSAFPNRPVSARPAPRRSASRSRRCRRIWKWRQSAWWTAAAAPASS